MDFQSGHTALFSSTQGPVTGCSRLPVLGNPEASSVAAAKGCAGVMMVDQQSGGRRRRHHMRRFHKGTRSVTRKGHKDFETWKGSKRYSEKRFKKLFGHKTMRSPLFSFAGGRRTRRSGYKKGSRSLTRPGHKDFETYKGSKMYNEKRFKKLFGRKTVRAPFFPFAGGQGIQSQPQSIENQMPTDSSVGQASSVYDQLDASASCGTTDNTKSLGPICNTANVGPDLTGGRRRRYKRGEEKHREGVVDHDWNMESDHSGNLYYGGRRRHRNTQQRGGYCQYGSDVAYSFGQSYGGIKLDASQSALANPVPYSVYNHCMK